MRRHVFFDGRSTKSGHGFNLSLAMVWMVTGALLALCPSAQDKEWISFASTRKGFCPCCLSVSEQSMLKFSIAFRIGSFSACRVLICCQLVLHKNIYGSNCLESLKKQSLLKLRSHVECEFPYVRSLGKQNKFGFFGPNHEDPRRHEASPSSFF